MELQNRNYNNLEEGKSDDLIYNPNQTPPDLDLARKHGKANRVYLSNQNGYQNVQDIESCSCCGLPVEGKLIPLTADLKELYHLGESCVQYFQLIKHSIGILVVFLLVSGYYNIITNYYGTDCKTPDEDSSYNYCPESVIISFSIANKRNHPDQLKTQLILNFLGVLASLFYSIYGIYQVRKTKHEFGETLTPADYTIEIDRIPPELEATEEQITTWLEGLGTSDNPIKVIRVLLTRCPDNDSTAYVSFEKVQHAKYIQSKFKICSPSFLGKSVFVKSAPEPMSIIQENLNFSRSRSSGCLKLIGYIAVLRACNFIGEHIPTAKEWTIYFFGEEFFLVRQFQIWSTIIIAVIIILVSLTIVFLSRFNRFKSQNAESCCTFLALFVIYFSILCGPLCSPNNFDRIDKTFENVGWIIIICPLLVPLLSIFDFSYFYKLYCRFSRLNRVTQEEAHRLFEGSNMDLGTKYAVVMNLQMIASFCAPIMPLALISAIIGLILCYWADKYTLLRRHTLPRPIDSSVIEQMIWFCFLSSYMFLTSTFLYFYRFEYGEAFPDETYWLLWAAFGICVASPLILEPVMKEKKFSTQVTETRTFNEAKQDFVVDYNITEPITTVEFFRRSFSARAGNSQE